MSIDVIRIKEHYEIYVDGKFEQSCDINELKDTLKEIKEKYQC